MHSVSSNGVANALGYLVWENPDSTQSFSAQDVTFDRQVPSEYSKLKIEFRPLNTENYFVTSECVIGYNTYLSISYVVLTGNARAVISDRLARYSSRTGISFSECRFWQSSTNTQQEINTRCIPTRIWAIK